MKEILTARGSFSTGSELADAVVLYGAALARAHDIDVVDIPFVRPGGTVGRASFAIGEGIPIASVTATRRGEEISEPGTLLDILDRAKAITAVASVGHAGFHGRDAVSLVSRRSLPFDDEGNWEDLI